MQSSIQVQSKQLVEEAKHSIRISAWNDTFSEYLPLLEEKAKQGIDIEALVVGEVETELQNVHFLIPTEEHNALERYLLLIVDDREILFAGVEQESWQAMKTMSQPFVKFLQSSFIMMLLLRKLPKNITTSL